MKCVCIKLTIKWSRSLFKAMSQHAFNRVRSLRTKLRTILFAYSFPWTCNVLPLSNLSCSNISGRRSVAVLSCQMYIATHCALVLVTVFLCTVRITQDNSELQLLETSLQTLILLQSNTVTFELYCLRYCCVFDVPHYCLAKTTENQTGTVVFIRICLITIHS